MKLSIKGILKSQSFKQLVKYGMVGVVGFAIDFGVYYLLVVKLAVHYPFTPFLSELMNGSMSVKMLDIDTSHIIGSALAIINNFILNSYFTFKVTDKKLKRFASFAGIASIGLVVSTLLITLFIGVLGLDEMLAKVIATLIVAFLQFIVNKLFTFKQKAK
jgi:putative flippase GtrA